MSRHWSRSLLLAALLGVPVAPAAAARVGPSFDCARAKAASERAICASTVLPALDLRVARAYAEAGRVLGGELGTWAEGRLRADQRSWLRRRDRCGADVACLTRELRGRAEVLSFRAPAPAGKGPPTGRFIFREAGGSASLLRLDTSRALVRLVTFHPRDARWICDVEGLLTAEGGRWVLRDPGGRAVAEVRERGRDGLTVLALLSVGDPDFPCGLNGSFAGEYRRSEDPTAPPASP